LIGTLRVPEDLGQPPSIHQRVQTPASGRARMQQHLMDRPIFRCWPLRDSLIREFIGVALLVDDACSPPGPPPIARSGSKELLHSCAQSSKEGGCGPASHYQNPKAVEAPPGGSQREGGGHRSGAGDLKPTGIPHGCFPSGLGLPFGTRKGSYGGQDWPDAKSG
jgi:hypothetical protein